MQSANTSCSPGISCSVVSDSLWPHGLQHARLPCPSPTLGAWLSLRIAKVKTLESPLDCKEIKPINPKQNQSWIFNGRTEGETPILWPPDAKNWFIGKDPDARKDWRQEEKGKTEMAGWHHWVDGHELEQAPRVGDGQGSLACCSPWGHKELDTTEWLNWYFELTVHTLLSYQYYSSLQHIGVKIYPIYFYIGDLPLQTSVSTPKRSKHLNFCGWVL